MLDALLFALASPLAVQAPTPIRVEVSLLPPVWVQAASSDGRWITGSHLRSQNWFFPFRWSVVSGLEGLDLPANEGRAITDDGEVVLTRLPIDFTHGITYTAAVWTPRGLKAFPGVGSIYDFSPAAGFAMSRDGRFVAGSGFPYEPEQPKPETAWLWEVDGEVQSLASAWGHATRALDVSDDGRVVVGLAVHERWPLVGNYPALWTDGMFEVLGADWGAAYGTNADGSFVTGEVGGRPFLWSRTRGMRSIETVDPILIEWFSTFRGKQVSDDGSTVLSRQVLHIPFLGAQEAGAHLWRAGAGAVTAGELLTALGAELPNDVLYVGLQTLGADGHTLVGTADTSIHPNAPSLLWRAVLPPAAEVYCTSQTSSGGCTPSIGFAGTPSARTGGGFTITSSDVPAGAQAVLAFGTSGAAAVPFGGGVLCVAEPTTRVALGSAGGNDPCEGAFAVDFNAVVAAAGDPALVGGAHVWTQLWIREGSSAPPQLLLSDALVFTLWP